MSATRFPFVELENTDGSGPHITISNTLLQFSTQPDVGGKLKEIFYTQKDLDDAKKVAFEEGEKQGMEAQRALDEDFQNRLLEALQAMIHKIEGLIADVNERIDDMAAGSVELAMQIAHKFEAFNNGEDSNYAALNFIKQNFRLFIEEPSIIITLHPQVYEQLNGKIESISKELGFKGSILLSQNADLEISDCDIEFSGATIKKSKKELMDLIDGLLEKYLGNMRATPQEDTAPIKEHADNEMEPANTEMAQQDNKKEEI